MVRVCINLNEQQKEIWERYKVFVKNKNYGAFYGHFTTFICEALLAYMENRTHTQFSNQKTEKINSTKSSRFMDILSYDDKENLQNSDYGMPYNRFEMLLSRIYPNMSESSFRNKKKETLRANNLVCVEDELTHEKYIYSNSNVVGLSFRTIAGKKDIEEKTSTMLNDKSALNFIDSLKND